jgi:hypothetical protein
MTVKGVSKHQRVQTKQTVTGLAKRPLPTVAPTTPQQRLERIEDWTKLSDEDRKRRGMVAANLKNVDELKSMTSAWFHLYGDKGLGSHPKTLKLYLKALEDLFELLPGENLLRPSKDMGVLFMRKLQALVVEEHGKRKRLAPATMNVKLYGVKTFYKALRWATGIEARPFDDVSPIPDPTDPAEKRLPYKPKEVEKLLEVCGEDVSLSEKSLKSPASASSKGSSTKDSPAMLVAASKFIRITASL